MLRTILTCLLTLILVIGGIPLAASLPADASLSNSAWPMAGHDARHTGLSSATGPTDPEIR
ncbi:MAG: hypothetical protein NTU59_02215 [Coprothermobacterota bacterium]|nr:hypothetical protein [Coprothermobacterota bacterium]